MGAYEGVNVDHGLVFISADERSYLRRFSSFASRPVQEFAHSDPLRVGCRLILTTLSDTSDNEASKLSRRLVAAIYGKCHRANEGSEYLMNQGQRRPTA